jgi:hypothetical protein
MMTSLKGTSLTNVIIEIGKLLSIPVEKGTKRDIEEG